MLSSSRGAATSGMLIALCCVFLLGLSISSTVIISLISVYLPSKGDELAASTCNLSFAPIITQSAGAQPSFIDDADFNNDKIEDLAILNYDAGSVSIALGNGDGTFRNRSTLSTGGSGSQPNALAIGDVNNDGNLDVVVVNSGTSNVGVFRGNGDGTFSAQTTYSTGDGSVPLGLALADLNNDNNLDLVVSDNSNNVVLIFLGSNAGVFTLTRTLSTSSNSGPYGVVVDDFNRDGQPDICISTDRASNLTIFLNTGSVTFTGPTTYATGATPYSITSVDLNKDEIIDLISSNYNGNSISILLGKGDGTFRQQKPLSTGAQSLPYSLFYGDFNRDQNVDIAVVNSGTNNVGIFLGNGRGRFQRQRTYSTGDGTVPVDVTVADFNRDGRDDIASANSKTNGASILLNTCS